MIGREIHYGQGDQILNLMYKMYNEVINDFSNERDMHVSLNFITFHEMSKNNIFFYCLVAVLYDMHCYFSFFACACVCVCVCVCLCETKRRRDVRFTLEFTVRQIQLHCSSIQMN